MAGASLLSLLDDIATILDDVAIMTKVAARKGVAMADDVGVMTKVAAQKTAGVLGDDLALNAQQVTGVKAERELPVVWAVAKGSTLNKVILVPAALLISLFAPWAITPLLMLGGAFLCFEGFEKVAHKLLHSAAEDAAAHASHVQANANPEVDLVAFEKDKIKGAVRTDFILSAEIIAITLGTVATASFANQVAVLVSIAVIMTVGVYGLVAGIVKLDDLGLWLSQKTSSAARALGRGILAAAPWLMKGLSIAGTAAMFLVGGGIVVHGVPYLHHAVQGMETAVAAWPAAGLWQVLAPNLFNAVVGLAVGGAVLALVTAVQRLRSKKPAH
jgi:predicted DNA repair protein MutK